MKSSEVPGGVHREKLGDEAQVIEGVDLEEGFKETKLRKKKKRKKKKKKAKSRQQREEEHFIRSLADAAAGPPIINDAKNRAHLSNLHETVGNSSKNNDDIIHASSQQVVDKKPPYSKESFSKISQLRSKIKKIEEDRESFRNSTQSCLSSNLETAPTLPCFKQDLSFYPSSHEVRPANDLSQASRLSTGNGSNYKKEIPTKTKPPFQLKKTPPDNKEKSVDKVPGISLHLSIDHNEDEGKNRTVQKNPNESVEAFDVPNFSFSPSDKKYRPNAAADSYDSASTGILPFPAQLSKKDFKNCFSCPVVEQAAENYTTVPKKIPLAPSAELAAESYDRALELEEGKFQNPTLACDGSLIIERRESFCGVRSSIKDQTPCSSNVSHIGAYSISTRVSGECSTSGYDMDNIDENMGIGMGSSGTTGTGHIGEIERSQEFLIEAEAVGESESEKVYATARPDPWWRRNQAWLAAVAVLLLATVLVSINLSDPATPTAAPTTVEEGIQESIRDLVLSQYPQTDFTEQTSAQSQAIQWIAEMKKWNREWYSDERILLQYGLVKLFLSTSKGDQDNTSWRKHNGWMESKNECEWDGIECDELGFILSLKLSDNNLNGELQPELSVISKELSTIDLSNNNLIGILPSEEIGKLTSLKYLDLSSNAITGSISSLIGGATNLVKLNLSNNRLNSIIPNTIGSLSMLELLDVGSNKLIGSIPSEIGLLDSIQQVNCQNNRLTYELPSEIGNLVSLEELNLQNNDLLGPLPSEIGLLTTLRGLNLSENHIFYQIPVEFYRNGALAGLESLDLSNNLLSGMLYDGEKNIYDFGGSWQKLRTLRLHGNYFKQELPPTDADLYSIPALEVLDLSSNYLTGAVPAGILKLSTVTSLDISDNQLTGRLPEFFVKMDKLNVLHFSKNKFHGALSSNISKLSALKIIDLSNSGLSGSLPSELGSLSLLKTLKLSRNPKIEGTVPTEIGQLTHLESLDFSFNEIMSGELPTELADLVNLECLDLSLNRFSGSIPTEYGGLTALTALRMSANLLNNTIPETFANFTRLQKLNLGHNDLSGSFPAFIEQVSMLSDLHLGGNRLAGAIPSELGLLNSLTSLKLYSNYLTGSMPSEIGNLQDIQSLSLTGNPVSGFLPSELANLGKLVGLSLSSTQLRGAIPSSLCDNIPTPNIWVDCEKVSCSCPSCRCGKSPEISTGTPTAVESVEQDQLPSMLPTELPRKPSPCGAFKSIRESGSVLELSDEPETQVDLSFSFNWGGSKNFSNINVGQFGEIKMHGLNEQGGDCFQGIALCMFLTDSGPPQALMGSIYILESETTEQKSVTVSWEGVQADDGSSDPYFLNFQVVLYANGQFELRWGEGAYSNAYRILAGATDKCKNNAKAAVTGDPFIYGVSANGLWPINQCRLFVPSDIGFYKEKR